uniref:TlpA family protein disulfide reductase n=1 Tax=Butyricimonas virosa TaxID=544645 RepID=UPI00402943DE
GACAGPKSARLHGSLKEFGSNNVKMELAGAVGDVSDINVIRIPVNDDGTFDLVVPLEKPTYFQIGRNTLYLSPGDDMEVNLGTSQPKSWFKGKGEEANNYLKGRLFPKAGSFMEAGRNVKENFEQTKKLIDGMAQKRIEDLKALNNVSKEFREMEMMRIKADLANSYMAYLWYSDLLKDCKTREEGEKVANDFNKSIREYINPLLKEISAKDKYLEVAVVRDVLSSCNEIDPSIFDFPKSQRLKELNEIYGVGERMDEEMTKSLYDELYAYGSKLKNADFKQAFLGRLEKRAKLMEGRPAIDFT